MAERIDTAVTERLAEGRRFDPGRLYALVLPPIVAFLLVIGVWEAIVAAFSVPAYFIPAPSRIGEVLVRDFASLAYNASVTLTEAVAGVVIGSVLGAGLGIVFAYSAVIARAFLPYVIAANTIPVVAIAPIIILWFGHGIQSKIAVTAFLSFFPLSMNMMKGLRSYDPLTADLFHVYAATPVQQFLKMRLPAALPYIFVGLKINVTFSVIGAIVAEFIQADKGLGFVIMTTYRQLAMPKLWAAMFASALIGLAFYGIVAFVERLAIPWHSSMREEA